jgi:hypothetical protein
MATSRYHNIFLRYRSRSPMDISEEQFSYAKERELEDNVTKALINLLEYSRGPALLQFLRLCKIEPSCPLEEYELALHEDIGGQGTLPNERFLLEIVPGKKELMDAKSALAKTDEPIQDARIQSRNEVCFIEVKIRGRVTTGQRRSYLEAYSIPEENVRPLLWDDLHSSFSNLLPRDTDISNTWLSVSGFLLAQFLEYLEFLGLSSFAGIRSEHFQILKKEIEEVLPEERARLKWLQGTYSSAIKTAIEKKDIPRLTKATEHVHLGKISRHEPVPWMSFSDQGKAANKTQAPHFGSSLHADNVKVYVSCEGKKSYSRFLNVCSMAPDKLANVTSRPGTPRSPAIQVPAKATAIISVSSRY